MMRKNVAILLFDQVEVLDFAGPFEVFSVADELHKYSMFNVFTVAPVEKSVTAVNGLKVTADFNFADCPHHIDYLILPGGDGTKSWHDVAQVKDWVHSRYQQAEHILSVCSGARFLASAGLLQATRFCTHQGVYGSIKELVADALPQAHLRFVTDGKLTSAGGISAGIDAAFDLLLRIAGYDVANKTATYMEYHRNHADSGFRFDRVYSPVVQRIDFQPVRQTISQ